MTTKTLSRRTSAFPSMLEDFLSPFMQIPFLREGGRVVSVPLANITESKDRYKIRLVVPDLRREDFKIDIENNNLKISAETEERTEQTDEQVTRQEYNFSSFERTFSLPEDVNRDHIQATYENGVLNIILYKKEEAVRAAVKKHIEIQ